jgi:hypothetical protein
VAVVLVFWAKVRAVQPELKVWFITRQYSAAVAVAVAAAMVFLLQTLVQRATPAAMVPAVAGAPTLLHP